MKKTWLLLSMMLVGGMGFPGGWGQEIEWTRQFGSADDDIALGVSVDASGVYVVGTAKDVLPGQTQAGGRNAFVRGYDLDGNEVWTRQFGTTAVDGAWGVSVDASGVYIVGRTGGALPGQTHAGLQDAFVRRYDMGGNEVWTRQFGTTDFDIALGVSVDASGVYVAGTTNDVLPGQTHAGLQDAFVRRYDLDGNEAWTRQFGTTANDWARGVSVDASGVYVTGDTSGTLPGQTNASDQGPFVRRYDLDGNEVWTRQFGTGGADFALGVSVDASGVYVAGEMGGALPGQTNAGLQDAFVRRYDLDGTEVWTRQFGSNHIDKARGVSADGSGVYVAGVTVLGLPGQANASSQEAFVRSYDLNGNEVWTHQFGSTTNDVARGVSVDASGVYVAGFTGGELPGQTNAGGGDAFVRKYSAAPIVGETTDYTQLLLVIGGVAAVAAAGVALLLWRRRTGGKGKA